MLRLAAIQSSRTILQMFLLNQIYTSLRVPPGSAFLGWLVLATIDSFIGVAGVNANLPLHMQTQPHLPHLHRNGMHLVLRKTPLLRAQQRLEMTEHRRRHF